jgi:predicted N-formylglutamate amidohydrolase
VSCTSVSTRAPTRSTARTRDLDIALLFDDARVREEDFCERWRSELRQKLAGDLRYRFNEPYHGADDGLTTTLRSRFAPEDYLGIEIELRQGMVLRSSEQNAAGDLLASALGSCLGRSVVR